MSQETVDDFEEMDRILYQSHAPKEKRRTTCATLRDLDSRRGNKWSVTSIRGRVQTGLLQTHD